MKTSVIGLGRIGLPLAVQAASRGIQTVGADISTDLVTKVNAGLAPFQEEEGLATTLAEVVADGVLRATTATADAVRETDVTVIVVPLVVDEKSRPDYSALDSATAAVGADLRSGQLVIFETTMPVGTTRNRLTPILERESGLVAGVDFFVAYSPERVLTGRVFRDLARYPKIVGGTDAEAGRRAVEFYTTILEFDDRPDLARPNGVWDLGSAEAAEFTKLAETTYRDVNIALANEFAIHAEAVGVDVHQVIAAANSQPFSHIHRPGVAVGGHCIPVYPRLYLHGHSDAKLPAAGRAINESMPRLAVQRIADVLGTLRGLRAVVLGVAYRGGVKQDAFSGVYPLVAELERHGATALVHDPMYHAKELESLGFIPFELGQPADVTILHTAHLEYERLSADDFPGCQLMLDGRGTLDPHTVAPIPVMTLGDGSRSISTGHA